MTELDAALIAKLAWADFPHVEITDEVTAKFFDVLQGFSYVEAREAVARVGRFVREFPPSAGLIYEEIRAEMRRRAQSAPGVGYRKDLPCSAGKSEQYLKIWSQFGERLDRIKDDRRFTNLETRKQIQQLEAETIEQMREVRTGGA
jgi:hypothetical protein